MEVSSIDISSSEESDETEESVNQASADGIEIIRDADGNVNVTVVVDYAGIAQEMYGIDINDWELLSAD